MPSEVVTLPSQIPIPAELRYLLQYSGPVTPLPVLAYLQRVRMPALTRNHPEMIEWLEKQYHAALPQLLETFSALLASERIDLIVAVPSSRQDVDPYRAAVVSTHAEALDLSATFRKNPEIAATTATSRDAVDQAITCDSIVVPATATRVLILDDIFSSGRSAAAVIARLRERGLNPKATVIIAAPLWVTKRHGG